VFVGDEYTDMEFMTLIFVGAPREALRYKASDNPYEQNHNQSR